MSTHVPLVLALLVTSTGLAGCILGPESEPQIPEPGPVIDTGLSRTIEKVAQVDAEKWSGEPSIIVTDEGTILITGVSGLTRYAEDPTDIPGRFGSSYIWRSTDDGDTWAFVDLGLPAGNEHAPYRNAVTGVEGDLAIDEAGHVYFVDLSFLATNGVARSDDDGATWTAAQSPAVGLPGTDRPWVAALGDGEVVMKYLQLGTGHRMARSTDGGVTFLEDVLMPSCSQADLAVDLHDRWVLVPCSTGGDISFLRAKAGEPLAFERKVVAEGHSASGGFPSMAVGGPGEYVLVWVERTDDETVDAAGTMRTMVAYSDDAGESWSEPLRLSPVNQSAIFPWVDGNTHGWFDIVWYQADAGGDPNDADATWHVWDAPLLFDHGSGTVTVSSGRNVTSDPVHIGSICNAGLGCVIDGRAEDRRLLDFFEVDVTDDGKAHITYTSTRTEVPTIWYTQAQLAKTNLRWLDD